MRGVGSSRCCRKVWCGTSREGGYRAPTVGVATVVVIIAGDCLMVGGFGFQVPFCLDMLDWYGRHIHILALLVLGNAIRIWGRQDVPYAERVRQGW